MTKTLTCFILAIALCMGMAQQAKAENLVSLYIGSFSPGGDYPDTAEEGGDFGVAYNNTDSTVGFEIGMHGYSTSAPYILDDIDIGVIGLEGLITFQPVNSTVQPYVGIGIGSYSITMEYLGETETGSGSGIVAELGVRFFLDQVFLGLQVKGFTNTWEDPNNPDNKFNFGGSSTNMTIGISF